eukprot:scpid53026/ scgid1714/ Transmembrane 6 superfamily member 1
MNVITAFLVSLLAIPVMRVFNNLDLMSDHRAIFISAAAVLAFIALIVYVNKLLTAHDKNPVNDKFVYVFVVFAFTSIVDLFIGLELHGFVEEYMAFYFKEGEPYLYTSHGMIINYWDGTGHYILALVLLYCITNRLEHRYTGLYWVGSIMNSMPVLLLGGLTGKFGHKVKPSFFLNTPYVLCPILFGLRILTSPRPEYKPAPGKVKGTRSAFVWILDAILIVELLICILVFIVKGVAASGSPSHYFHLYASDYEPYLLDATNFGTIQAFQYAAYYIPACIAVIYGLCVPGCAWLPDVSALVAGGVMQGQLSYIVSSLAQRTDPLSRVPGDALPVFWCVNLAVLLVPQFLLVRTMLLPRFFATPPKSTKTS